jgi:iron(III) transport system substrate-binding protein
MHRIIGVVVTVLALALAACGGGDDEEATGGGQAAPDEPAAEQRGGSLTVYSGRDEELVGPLIERFEEQSGTEVEVRYGDSAELAATILTEGENSPAGVFFSQDAGALGALQAEGRLTELPQELLDQVPAEFRSRAGQWVGASGRARIIAFDERELSPPELPQSVLGLTDEEWGDGRIGWSPTNGSFQAFVTALRVTQGDDVAREFLEGIEANDPVVFDGNTDIRDGIADGEVDVGLINHYYVIESEEEDPEYPVGIFLPPGGDIGSLINVAGVGAIAGSEEQPAAEAFVEYLLSEDAQRYFAEETKEYPLIEGVEPDGELVPLAEIQQPDVDLSQLEDLEGTVELLEDTGVL